VVHAGALAVVAGARFPISYQFIASGLVGPVAYTAERYAYMGVALHFAVAVAWALGYMLVASHTGRLRQWVPGGIALGLAAWAGMQVVLWGLGMTAGLGGAGQAFRAAGEHVVFFGLLVAWLLRRM